MCNLRGGGGGIVRNIYSQTHHLPEVCTLHWTNINTLWQGPYPHHVVMVVVLKRPCMQALPLSWNNGSSPPPSVYKPRPPNTLLPTLQLNQMADPRELAATTAGLCLNFSDFAPEWVTLETIFFLISTGLAVFDTYSDWKVVLDFKNDGFNNPLLPPNDHWLYAWLLFASLGTFLTLISFFQDGHCLLYSVNGCCKKHCCEPSRSIETTLRTSGLGAPQAEPIEGRRWCWYWWPVFMLLPVWLQCGNAQWNAR